MGILSVLALVLNYLLLVCACACQLVLVFFYKFISFGHFTTHPDLVV